MGGLFGCFGNCGVCCFGYCCSCCQVYKNAESLGKSGILCCLLSMVLPCAPTLLLRQEARDRWNIEGEGRRCCSRLLLHSLRQLPNCRGNRGEGSFILSQHVEGLQPKSIG